MNKLITGLVVTLGALILTPGETQPPTEAVVGTFDSRAVAMAYVRSTEFTDYLSEQQTHVSKAISRAEKAGDHELLTALNALGPAMQARIHRQGFGAAPIDDILARLEDRLPGIAKEHGVAFLVSKWAVSYRGPEAESVDVTDALVAEFNPSEKTLEAIASLIATDPVQLDQLKGH